jgi:hypothetical protein
MRHAPRPAPGAGEHGHDPRHRQRARPGQPGLDSLQAVVGGHDRIRFLAQHTAEKLVEVTVMLVAHR